MKRAVRERWQFYTLKSGLGAFPERLAQRLKDSGVLVLTGQACSRITFTSNGAKVSRILAYMDICSSTEVKVKLICVWHMSLNEVLRISLK